MKARRLNKGASAVAILSLIGVLFLAVIVASAGSHSQPPQVASDPVKALVVATTTVSTTSAPISLVPATTSTAQPKPKESIQYTSPKPSLPKANAGLSNDHYYTNSKGNSVHSPAYSATVPDGASAQCRDGTYSFSQSRRGTCSHHGGVASWLQ